MTHITENPTPPPSSGMPGIFRPENRGTLGTALLIGSAAMAVLAVVLMVWKKGDVWPITVWALLTTFSLLFVGLWARFGMSEMSPNAQEAADSMRLLGMALGGLLGLSTALLGMAMPFAMYSDIFSAGLEVWRQNALSVFFCALTLFGGLAMLFLSLMLGRSLIRGSASIRRLVYGYNAVLTALLLISIFGLFNLLTYARVPPFHYFARKWDWSEKNIFSLSTASRDILERLEEPVKVYALMHPETYVGKSTVSLLENCRAITDKLTWRVESRDENQKEVARLMERYQLPESVGLLVVYGVEPNERHEFIRVQDMITTSEPPRGRGPEEVRDARIKVMFKGENVLMNAIRTLSENKDKPIVYFTQGSGEPSLGGDMAGPAGGRTLFELRERLERANFQVKELTFKGLSPKVPDDAGVVVVAGPRPGLPENATKALLEYSIRPKSKLIVLLDVVPVGDPPKMASSGLQDVLAQFDVEAGNERILSARSLTELEAIPNTRSRNPIARAFDTPRGPKLFYFDDARPVQGVGGGRPGKYRVEPLIGTSSRIAPVWKEANLIDPERLIKTYSEKPEQLEEKLTGVLVLAVAVTEPKSGMPMDAAHAGLQPKDDVPRLVVFGDAGWITDAELARGGGKLGADLFVSCANWLRERPGLGEAVATDTEVTQYSLANSVDETGVSRMRWIPLGVLLLVVVGLGGAIWVVRRR